MAINSSLYVALTGMKMSQSAMEVASNNISNVNTPGYSRQRINLATMPTWKAGSWGQLGTGVTADNITRYHDEFLTRSLVTKASSLGRTIAGKNAADSIEAYFNESNTPGINSAMNTFWTSWDRLAGEPSSKARREELIQQTESMAQQFKNRKVDMEALRTDLNTKVSNSLEDINSISKEISSLNQQISLTEDQKNKANDLRDNRDELTRRLSELIEIAYYEDPHDGALTITTTKGVPLVLKNDSFDLVKRLDGKGDVRISSSHSKFWKEDITDSITEGALGGWLKFRDDTLRRYYLEYDSFVDNAIFHINNQHAQGAGTSFYKEAAASSLISNLPAYNIPFEGEDNNIKVTALTPHLVKNEPYNPMTDPDNLSIRFIKANPQQSEITSSVVFNNAPDVMKWEITVVLPVDSNGNVIATSKDVIKHINTERSPMPSAPVFTLPPKTYGSPPKIGDFIAAESSFNNDWTGIPDFPGKSFPPGNGFFNLNRSLKNVTAQGHHLKYGKENAELKTYLPGKNNTIIFKALQSGDEGEKISIQYVKSAGSNQPLSLTVAKNLDGSKNITVNLGTDNIGNINTKAADIVAAINSDISTRDLISAETPSGESANGLVSIMDKTFLDRSGYFELVTYDQKGDATFHRVTVTPEDTVQDIVKQIGSNYNNGIFGVRAEVYTDQHGKDSLRIIADQDAKVTFGFANDSSGALAVLGLNNILTGSTGSDASINQALLTNRDLIAAGKIDHNGLVKSGDNRNALEMANLKEERFNFYHLNSATLGSAYGAFYSDIGATAQSMKRDYEFNNNIYTQLENRQDSLAGVNLDEELADIMKFQYMYQSSAKIISTIDSMMDTLLAIR